MKFRKFIVVLSFLIAAYSTTTQAWGSRDYDYAEVIHVQPIYTVERQPISEKECWDEIVTRNEHKPSAVGIITGGVVGGVLGNRIGKGHGREAITLAGAVIGGAIGNSIAQHSVHAGTQTEERCRVYHTYIEKETMSGYRVKYRYGNRIYVNTLPYDQAIP